MPVFPCLEAVIGGDCDLLSPDISEAAAVQTLATQFGTLPTPRRPSRNDSADPPGPAAGFQFGTRPRKIAEVHLPYSLGWMIYFISWLD